MRELLIGMCVALLISGNGTLASAASEDEIDWEKARKIRQKEVQGQTVTAEEKAYLDRAVEARRKMRNKDRGQEPKGPAMVEKSSTGLIPLIDMSAKEKYKARDGGLYGGGENRPPKAHREAAEKELAAIHPLNAEGKPDKGGKIVLISVGMSNTTQEFSRFRKLADADKQKSPRLVIVDCAQGGKDAANWADKADQRYRSTWQTVRRRLKAAGVTQQQVQMAWVKHARRQPASHGEFPKHAKEMQGHLASLVSLLKRRFPNLRICYLSSRIYAGYANTPLNPEPYAYESAFSVRWLIREQIEGEPKLNYDPKRGKVNAPLLLWGPYLWSDGINGRRIDDLVYKREDLAKDGTHPSDSGREKVGKILLKFFKTDPLAKSWFVRKER